MLTKATPVHLWIVPFLEGDPHSVLEGMIIGAYAIEATRGLFIAVLNIRLAIKRLNIASGTSKRKRISGKEHLWYGRI